MDATSTDPRSTSQFRILGPLAVTSEGRDATPSSEMQRRVLTALLVRRGSIVSADALEHVLWGDTPPRTARKTLQTLISRLRGAVGSDRIVTHPGGYALRHEGCLLDAGRFEELATEGRASIADDPARALAVLDEALALWRGDALGEFSDEEFASPEARRLDELRLGATEDRFDALLGLRQHDTAVAELEGYVADNPFRERPHGQLMSALYRSGRSADALALYRAFRERLIDELGLEPSSGLEQLELQILQHDEALGGGVEHGIGDPPLWTGAVPAATNRLIGRSDELAALDAACERSRLVTITGPPGVGKTRLTMAFGARASESRSDGLRWCELSTAETCCPVADWVMSSLGLQRRGPASVVEQLLAALAGRDLLLVLDNCEQVIAEVAHLVDLIISHCPRISVLATSREPMRLPGEQLFPLEPLSVSLAAGEPVSPAVRLFEECARSVQPDFELDGVDRQAVEDICRKLDGLPLAIELVAAELRAFTPVEVVERLEQHLIGSRTRAGAVRHRSLDAAIDWSYSELSEDERTMFDTASVFVGGFELSAAERVTGLDADRLATSVQGLVDRSLLTVRRRPGRTRYTQLHALRSFGARRLAASGRQPAVQAAYAQWMADLVEELAPDLEGSREAAAVDRLDTEAVNLRAVHAQAVTAGDVDTDLRLVAGLRYFAPQRLRDDIYTWMEEAVALPGARHHRLYPLVAGTLAFGLVNRWDLDGAERHARLGLAVCGHDDERAPDPLLSLGLVEFERGNLRGAADFADRGIRLARGPGSEYLLALGHLLASSCRASIDPDLAQSHRDELASLAEKTGNPTLLAWALLVGPRRRAGRSEDLREAVSLACSVRNLLVEGLAMRALADAYLRQDRMGPALTTFRRLIDHWHARADWAHQLATIARVTDALVRVGDADRAAVLHGVVASGYRDLPRSETMPRVDDVADELSRQLGPGGIERAVGRGHRMSRREAVDMARHALDDALRQLSHADRSVTDDHGTVALGAHPTHLRLVEPDAGARDGDRDPAAPAVRSDPGEHETTGARRVDEPPTGAL